MKPFFKVAVCRYSLREVSEMLTSLARHIICTFSTLDNRNVKCVMNGIEMFAVNMSYV